MIKNITYIEEKQHWSNESGHTFKEPHLNCTATYHHLVTVDPPEGMVSRRKQTKANISILNVFTLFLICVFHRDPYLLM